jgi:hypothetical protein
MEGSVWMFCFKGFHDVLLDNVVSLMIGFGISVAPVVIFVFL